MKRSIPNFLRIAQFPVIIAFGLLPFPMIFWGYLAQELLVYAWTLPVSYLVFTVVSFFVPAKLRIVYGLVMGIAVVVPWFFIATGPSLPIALLAALIFAVILFWSTRIGGWPSDKELHSAWYGVCFGIQLIGQGIFYIDGLLEESVFARVTVWFVLSFLVMSVLIFLSLNRNALNAITTKRPRMAVLIRKKNIFLVLVLFGIAFLFSLIPSAAGILSVLISWLAALFEHDSEVPIETTAPTVSTGMQKPGFGIEANIGLHTDILNAIFIVFAVIILAIVIPVMIYILVKSIIDTLKNIWKTMIADAANYMDDYDDEVTDTRDSVIQDDSEATRRMRMSFLYNDRGLGAKERVRYRYKYLLGRHPEWQKGSTVRENLPEETAAIYERARYSQHPISAEEADRFRTETKKI